MTSARILSFCLPCFIAAFTAAPARCSIIQQYSSSSQWLANATPSGDITFGQYLGGQNMATISGGTVTTDGVEFVGVASPSDLLNAYSPNLASWYNFNTGDSSPVGFLGTSAGVATPEIQIDLPTLVTAFGLDLMSISANGPYSVTVDGTTYTSVATQVAPTVVFFGATFTTPVSQITLTMPSVSGQVELIDDFQFGAADADSPELVTMLMIGTGLIGFTWLRRRTS